MSGDDKELKSAFEIALERAGKLGGMSSEEKRKLEDEKCASFGIALGTRYLKGLPIRDIELELARHKEDRAAITRYLVSFLADKIDLGDPESSEGILEAVQHFSGNSSAVQDVRNLLVEYHTAKEQARRERRSELAASLMSELEQKGISGSAVEPAVEASSEWLQSQKRLHSEYQKRLQKMILPLQAL